MRFVTISLFCAVSNICISKTGAALKIIFSVLPVMFFINNAYDFNSFNYF